MSGSAAVEAASADAAPRFPDIHLFDTDLGHHLLLVDGSRVFDIDADLRAAVEAVASRGRGAVAGLLAAHGLEDRPFIGDSPLKEPPLRALSLAIAQKCNLACTYCYAQEGSFGGPPTDMTAEVGRAAVRRLMADARPGERVSLAFLGGEPLTRRPLLKELTELAASLAAERGLSVGFSITTNGTLLRPDDADFFERYRFTVTVSIDGIGEAHDRQRPAKGGAGSYERILARLGPLLALGAAAAGACARDGDAAQPRPAARPSTAFCHWASPASASAPCSARPRAGTRWRSPTSSSSSSR